MLKIYVCEYCRGKGRADVTDAEVWQSAANEWPACPQCVGKGAPPWVEIAVSGPPSTKEQIIEMTIPPVSGTLE